MKQSQQLWLPNKRGNSWCLSFLAHSSLHRECPLLKAICQKIDALRYSESLAYSFHFIQSVNRIQSVPHKRHMSTRKNKTSTSWSVCCVSASSSYDGKVETAHVGGKNLPSTISTEKLRRLEEGQSSL
jgi:hypothetical protein